MYSHRRLGIGKDTKLGIKGPGIGKGCSGIGDKRWVQETRDRYRRCRHRRIGIGTVSYRRQSRQLGIKEPHICRLRRLPWVD